MSIADSLRAAGLAVFPCWVRYDPATGRWAKGPAVPRGTSWRDAGTLTGLDWSSGVVGVPIPPRVVVLDLDEYKGGNRAAIERYLGCPLNWGAALIQRTISGGQHYAFRCDWDVRQLQGAGPVGFDTRAAGRGFICTGEGYTPCGLGVYAMLLPDQLPPLPDAARAVLERVDEPAPARLPAEAPDDRVVEALRYIDPGCNRAEWVRVGLALRDHYRHDEADGCAVFDRWSAGEYWPAGAPANYVPEHVPHQWGSFKPDGKVTIATLFYRAMRAGWTPPPSFDVSGAFGANPAPLDVFAPLVEAVRRDGCDVTLVPALVERIRASGCNALQIALLAAELKQEVKDRSVARHIDSLLHTAPAEPFAVPGQYGKSDTANAVTFLHKFFPGERLIRCDGELYGYFGKVWSRLSPDTFRHLVACDMAASQMQAARINAATDLIGRLVPVVDRAMNLPQSTYITFGNGVLDVHTGQLLPHSPEYLTTVLTPFDFDPAATCPAWLEFLDGTLDGDEERIALLQEWLGYLLVANYRHQKVMLMIGPRRCGKGTIGRVIQALVGGANFTGGSLSSFARDSFLDGLRTKSVMFIGDAEKRVANALVAKVTERLKTISGNDAVDFDRKFLSSVSATLPTRITVATNSVPVLFDDSGALASRLLVLPFYRSFYGREDLHLIDALLPELPGIAVWALQGMARLASRGVFTEPAASREERNHIDESFSPLSQFVSDGCEVSESAACSSADLYAAYRVWAVRECEDMLRPKTFVSAIKDLTRGAGVRYGTFNGVRGFRGLRPGPAPTVNSAAFRPTNGS